MCGDIVVSLLFCDNIDLSMYDIVAYTDGSSNEIGVGASLFVDHKTKDHSSVVDDPNQLINQSINFIIEHVHHISGDFYHQFWVATHSDWKLWTHTIDWNDRFLYKIQWGNKSRPVWSQKFVCLQVARDILKNDDGSEASTVDELMETVQPTSVQQLLNGRMVI